MNDNDFTKKIDIEREYKGLNENGAMSRRRIERNKVNAPTMLDYASLANALKQVKPQNEQSLWGFVTDQNKKNEQDRPSKKTS